MPNGALTQGNIGRNAGLSHAAGAREKSGEAESDPAKLRELVYEAARLALKRHVNVHYPAISLQDGKRLLAELEAAIERLETGHGGTIARPAQVKIDAASMFAPDENAPEAAFHQFDFRAAIQERLESRDRATDPENDEAPLAANEDDAAPLAAKEDTDDRVSHTRPDHDEPPARHDENETPTTLAPAAEDPRPSSARSDDDAGRTRKPAGRPRPNRFDDSRPDRPRPAIATRDRDEDPDADHDDDAWRDEEPDEQASVSTHVPEHRGRPRDWPDDGPNGGSASRELILVPDHSVTASRGATYLVRPDEFPPRYDPYYRPPPVAPKPAGRGFLIGIGIVSQVVVVLLAGAAFYVAMWGRGGLPLAIQSLVAATRQLPADPVGAPVATEVASPAGDATAAAASVAPTPPAPAFPRPTAYGIYAISDNRLIELEQAATAPVDPRTRSTLAIAKPSRTVITDPKLTFVAYRRDLISSAPDKVPVRIAARIAKQMTFDGAGKAVTAPPSPTETWLVRDQGLRSAGFARAREPRKWVLLRPDGDDFSFPAGRYELVLGGQNYDFAIAGPVTDPAQCVEGVATGRGPVFYECRTP